MRTDPARFRSRRRVWWLRPLVILPALGLLLLGVPMFLWIHTYGSTEADSMFVITWLSLLVWQIHLTKGTIDEPHTRVNYGEFEKEKRSIDDERRRKRAAVYATEIGSLEKGERTTVLDVWKLDPTYLKRNPFIEMLVVSAIDPASSEWHLRVHLTEDWTFAEGSDHPTRIMKVTRSFLRFIAAEPDAELLSPFATTLVLIIDKNVDDGSLTGAFIPIVSILVTSAELRSWAKLPPTNANVGEVRFKNGSEVEPHRAIEVGTARGK